MATEIKTVYTAYSFTEEEYTVAVTFTELQLKHLQTELANYAQVKALDGIGENTVEVYLRAQEFQRGCMSAIMALIATHENALTELKELAEQNFQTQSEE